MAAADERQSVGMAAGLVIEGAKFHAEIIAQADKAEMFLQLAQASRGFFAEPFPKLVALKEEARIGGIGLGGAVICAQGFGRPVADVKVSKAEIAPNDGVTWIELNAAFPKPDGFFVAAAVVEQVAEVIGRAGVARIGGHRRLEDGDLLEP